MTTYTNDLIKVNGDFSATSKAKDYAINPVWQDYDALWDFVSASQEQIGEVVYEHIANLVQNVRDIDTCGLHQLYSIAKELDVEQIFSYDLAYPVELEEIMNTLSTNRSFLLTSGYILNNETLDDIYTTLSNPITTTQYYDISGNIAPSSDFVTSGFVTDEWRIISPTKYTSTPSTTSRILMSNTSDFNVGSPVKFTDLSGTFRTQCVDVSDNSYIEISGYPLNVLQPLTLLETANPIYVIWDWDYITGFVEPVIKNNLLENANYNETTETTWDEDQIDTFYSEFSGYISRLELEDLANSKTLTPRYLISLQYQGFMDDIYYDPSSVYQDNSGEIIDYCTHILRNICIRASYQRETLKTIAQKHAMIGSTRSIEKLLEEYILRSFTKKGPTYDSSGNVTDIGWRLYVEPSGGLPDNDAGSQLTSAYVVEQYLPSINSIANPNFYIDVIEYWDNTEYMNISAESPLVCGIIGYAETSGTTSTLDLSGNTITGTVTGWTPIYAQGLCGYVVTGGNPRFWEGENLTDAILISETNSGEVSAFYKNVGLTGTLEQMWSTQTNLWDIHATSGLNRMATIPELTGTPTSAYINTPTSAIPASGWEVEPTSLSGMHKKYIGVLSGDVPPANWKNQLYPTIAPQPFIWNLIEKIQDEFPTIFQTLLYTDQTTSKHLSSQVDADGNLIDSWLEYNQEYIGYGTAYEQSNNLDFNEQANPSIDRDGPFDVDALSGYIYHIKNGDTPISEYMSGYYDHIEKNFSLVTSQSPNIELQLETFPERMFELSGLNITNYSYDHLDHHYMLYKEDEEFETPGELWMRYRNHPLPFPFSDGTESDKETQQVYIQGGVGESVIIADTYNVAVHLETVFSKCYDFGIIGDIMWAFGQSWVTTPPTEPDGYRYDDRIVVFALQDIYFSEPKEYHYSTKDSTITHMVGLTNKENFIGVYNHLQDIIFVYLKEFRHEYIDGVKQNYGEADFVFKHYNRYNYDFIYNHPNEHQTIRGYYDPNSNQITPLRAPMETGDHIWKLAAADDIVTIGYESINSSETSDFANSITTIDFLKNNLNDSPGEYAAYEWKHVVENT